MSPPATVAALAICGPEEERVMTNPSHQVGTAQGALREAVLSLGGMIALHHPGEDLGEAVARALGAVVRRHLSASAGMSSSMKPSTRLRPHPAITQLLDLIGSAPDTQEEATQTGPGTPELGDDEWLRLPGLFRRWELEQVVDGDHDLHVEPAGHCEDGTSLFAAYARAHERREDR